MNKSELEQLRRFYELTYRMENSSAIVVAELGTVDYTSNATVREYKDKGYRLLDTNRFGTISDGTVGEFLVFVKTAE